MLNGLTNGDAETRWQFISQTLHYFHKIHPHTYKYPSEHCTKYFHSLYLPTLPTSCHVQFAISALSKIHLQKFSDMLYVNLPTKGKLRVLTKWRLWELRLVNERCIWHRTYNKLITVFCVYSLTRPRPNKHL